MAGDGLIWGYARVSSAGQSLDAQIDLLKRAGCHKVVSEKVSGRSREGREELHRLLDHVLRDGDTLLVTRVDRLARSIGDLQDIVRDLRAKGVSLKATEQPIDVSWSAGTAFLNMLAVFSEFEASIRRERQMEGIARAKAAGVYRGRKPSVDRDAVRTLRAEGIGAKEIAERLNIGRASVYRALAKT